MSILSFLVVVLILCVVYWAVHTLAATCGLAPQIVVVIDVILVIVAIWWLLGLLGAVPAPRLR